MPLSVLLVGIDGLGGTYLEDSRNNWPFRMPFLHSLYEAAAQRQQQKPLQHSTSNLVDNNVVDDDVVGVGFATLAATTVYPPTSAPAWTSALTGMTPDQTGIVDKCLSASSASSSFVTQRQQQHREIIPPTGCCTVTRSRDDPHVHRTQLSSSASSTLSASLNRPAGNVLPVTIFDILPASHWYRGMYSSWSWLASFVDGCILDDVVDGHGNDEAVVEQVVRQMTAVDDASGKPNAFCMVHLDGVDAAGHRHGWGSEEYLGSWTTVDDHLKQVVTLASDHAARKGRQLITVVVSDHGGSERDHGQMLISHMRIPLVVLGGGAAAPYHHTRSAAHGGGASIIDIAPTILALAGLAIPHWVRGTPLLAPRPPTSLHATL